MSDVLDAGPLTRVWSGIMNRFGRGCGCIHRNLRRERTRGVLGPAEAFHVIYEQSCDTERELGSVYGREIPFRTGINRDLSPAYNWLQKVNLQPETD
jgi:hypothetical protein